MKIVFNFDRGKPKVSLDILFNIFNTEFDYSAQSILCALQPTSSDSRDINYIPEMGCGMILTDEFPP